MEKIKTGRRSFLKTTAEVVGLSAVAGLRPANVAASGPAMPESFTTGGPAVIALDDKGVIETIYGKVRGSQRNGIQIFRGIPYGADTGGENRFMPAKEAHALGGNTFDFMVRPYVPCVLEAGRRRGEVYLAERRGLYGRGLPGRQFT
jgi:hypothetical protein